MCVISLGNVCSRFVWSRHGSPPPTGRLPGDLSLELTRERWGRWDALGRESRSAMDPSVRRLTCARGYHHDSPGQTAVSVCGDGSAKCLGDRPMELDRVDVAIDHRARIVHAELGEQVRDLAPLRSQDLALGLEVPELALERADGLLARRVHELLVGLARLALIGDVREAPRLDLPVERLGER